MKKEDKKNTTTKDTAKQTNNNEQQPKPRHPDADYVQKTHFGYVGAYA